MTISNIKYIKKSGLVPVYVNPEYQLRTILFHTPKACTALAIRLVQLWQNGWYSSGNTACTALAIRLVQLWQYDSYSSGNTFFTVYECSSQWRTQGCSSGGGGGLGRSHHKFFGPRPSDTRKCRKTPFLQNFPP